MPPLAALPIADTPVAIFDFETTGLRPGPDRVIEVAVVSMIGHTLQRLVAKTLRSTAFGISTRFMRGHSSLAIDISFTGATETRPGRLQTALKHDRKVDSVAMISRKGPIMARRSSVSTPPVKKQGYLDRLSEATKHPVMVLFCAGLAAFVMGFGAHEYICKGVNKFFPPKFIQPNVNPSSDLIADFSASGRWARNAYNCEWKIFNDNKWGGTSNTWYELMHGNGSKDNFLRAHVALTDHIDVPYCGIYTEFSAPPYATLDASAYSGIAFKARCTLVGPNANVTWYAQLAVMGIPDYKYHEAEFELSPNGEAFATVHLPFSKFVAPDHAEEQLAFDRSLIFRVGFVAKGKKVDGTLDIDDIRWVR